MGKRDYFAMNDHPAICDRCGAKFKASECQMEWDNLFVCYHCYEERQPQDFVRAVKDDQSVEIARPRGEDHFLAVNEVTPESL